MRTRTQSPLPQISHLSVKSHSGIAPDPSSQPEFKSYKNFVTRNKKKAEAGFLHLKVTPFSTPNRAAATAAAAAAEEEAEEDEVEESI